MLSKSILVALLASALAWAGPEHTNALQNKTGATLILRPLGAQSSQRTFLVQTWTLGTDAPFQSRSWRVTMRAAEELVVRIPASQGLDFAYDAQGKDLMGPFSAHAAFKLFQETPDGAPLERGTVQFIHNVSRSGKLEPDVIVDLPEVLNGPLGLEQRRGAYAQVILAQADPVLGGCCAIQWFSGSPCPRCA